MLRPTVDVRLERADLAWTTKALIDTGAPSTVFDRGAGEALGFEFAPPRRDILHFLGGEQRWAQVETVILQLEPFQDMWWETEVSFLIDEWDMPFGLLGQLGFLDRWVVSFNYYNLTFVVEEPDSFQSRLPPDAESEAEWRELGWKGPPRTR